MDPIAIYVTGALLGAGCIGFLLLIRMKDLPAAVPVSPFKHLDERKASIYENLRDLQFEYRVGKLSDADYQTVKLDLQKNLAQVLAEIDRVKAEIAVSGAAAPRLEAVRKADAAKPAKAKNQCPYCGAQFDKALKFCGECGKPMGGSIAQVAQ